MCPPFQHLTSSTFVVWHYFIVEGIFLGPSHGLGGFARTGFRLGTTGWVLLDLWRLGGECVPRLPAERFQRLLFWPLRASGSLVCHHDL